MVELREDWLLIREEDGVVWPAAYESTGARADAGPGRWEEWERRDGLTEGARCPHRERRAAPRTRWRPGAMPAGAVAAPGRVGLGA